VQQAMSAVFDMFTEQQVIREVSLDVIKLLRKNLQHPQAGSSCCFRTSAVR